MAIRFVDKTPEDETDHQVRVSRPRSQGHPSPSAKAEPDTDPPAESAAADQPGDADPKLQHPKPVAKLRGRKAPSPRAATPVAEPVQVPLEGLLPTLPHAKPEPKPRGRKKAFG